MLFRTIALKARAGQAAGEIEGLRARVAADATDHQARLDLAAALAAVDERDEAVDVLIASIKADRTWNDDAARKELITLFEALDRKSTRLNSSHSCASRMPSSA